MDWSSVQVLYACPPEQCLQRGLSVWGEGSKLPAGTMDCSSLSGGPWLESHMPTAHSQAAYDPPWPQPPQLSLPAAPPSPISQPSQLPPRGLLPEGPAPSRTSPGSASTSSLPLPPTCAGARVGQSRIRAAARSLSRIEGFHLGEWCGSDKRETHRRFSASGLAQPPVRVALESPECSVALVIPSPVYPPPQQSSGRPVRVGGSQFAV